MVAVTVCFAVLSCSFDNQTEVAGPGLAAELVDREFVSRPPADDGATTQLRFDGERLNFSADCNGHGGAYVIRERMIVVDRLGSTLAGCEESPTVQTLLSVLDGPNTVTLVGSALTIANARESVAFTDE